MSQLFAWGGQSITHKKPLQKQTNEPNKWKSKLKQEQGSRKARLPDAQKDKTLRYRGL